MKKLLIIALAGIMILSMALVSMAATTVGGELKAGFNLSGNDPFTQNDTGSAKVTVNADLNDQVTAFAALLADPIDGNKVGIDEAWAQLFGKVKVGYFPFNVKDNMDIFANLMNDIKMEAGIQVAAPVANGVTLKGYVARPTEDSIYSVGVDYANDTFGGSIHMVSTTQEDVDMLTALNAFYNLGQAKAYLNYETQGEDSSAYIGGLYDSNSIYARAEYQVVKPEAQDSGNVGFRVGYKLNDNVKFEYNSATDYTTNADAEAVSSIKMITTF